MMSAVIIFVFFATVPVYGMDDKPAQEPEKKIAASAAKPTVAAPEEKPVEEEKVKIEVSEKEIDARVPFYKESSQDIIRDAEAKIKMIDSQLKAEDNEREAKERYDKGNEFYKDGKFEEAEKEWNAAFGLAKELEFRKRIRGSLKRAARQIRGAKEKRETEERAKKDAEKKEKLEALKKSANGKK